MNKFLFSFIFHLSVILVYSQNSPVLHGTAIGGMVSPSSDPTYAFDGDENTVFLSSSESHGWVGLDLETPHIITGVSWMPDPEHTSSLGVFQGANSADFMDAFPLFVYKGEDTEVCNYAEVNVSMGCRYVRYMGPSDSYCGIREITFYGDPGIGDDSQFYQLTNLPLVTINVENALEPEDKVNDLRAIITLVSEEGTKMKSDSGTVRLRGNTSMTFPKKPYRIKFDSKRHLLKSPAKAKKWTLINNYGDKSLLRNPLAFEMSRRAGMAYTPFCEAVDLIFNGEYKGSYQLCDQIEVGEGRVDIEKMDETCVAGETLTGGYLMESDGYYFQEPEAEKWIFSVEGNPIAIKSPDKESILDVQYNYIKDYYNQFETTLFSNSWNNQTKGYYNYLDLDSFLRYFLMEELAGNTDSFWSTFLYKPRNNKIFTGPVWDFDLAFDNDQRLYPLCERTTWAFIPNSSYHIKDNVLKIVDNDNRVIKMMKEMWKQLRLSKAFDVASLHAYITEQEMKLDESQSLNYRRWDNMDKLINENPVVWGSFEAEVQQLRDFISDRMDWMDQKMSFDRSLIRTESYELTVSVYGYATLYLECPVTIPEGVRAFVGTEIVDGALNLEELEATIPANTAVIIKAAPGQYAFAPCNYVSPKPSLLEGNLVDTAVEPETVYTLGVCNGEVAFYRYSGNTLLANRAYLPIASMQNAKIRIDGSPEGVDDIGFTTTDVIYDFMGRPSQSLQQGLNIRNGMIIFVQ